MSSSEDWYCGWFRVTAAVTSDRMARRPNEVSVRCRPTSALASQAKT